MQTISHCDRVSEAAAKAVDPAQLFLRHLTWIYYRFLKLMGFLDNLPSFLLRTSKEGVTEECATVNSQQLHKARRRSSQTTF